MLSVAQQLGTLALFLGPGWDLSTGTGWELDVAVAFSSLALQCLYNVSLAIDTSALCLRFET